MKILVTGAYGFLGRNLVKKLSEKGYDVVGISRKHVDLTDQVAVQEYFKHKKYDVVIHAAVKGGSRLEVDSAETFYTNLLMFNNLLSVRDHYSRFLHFGSGAELDRSLPIGRTANNVASRNPTDPYGLSKNVIARMIENLEGFYNLRIFAVFGEDELDTRFIKANVKKYIQKEPLEVFKNKYMDFYYIEDLITLVEIYCTTLHPPKHVDCCYNGGSTLLDIVEYINTLSDYRVEIKVGSGLEHPYLGHKNITISEIGLTQGIKNVYNSLLNADKLSN